VIKGAQKTTSGGHLSVLSVITFVLIVIFFLFPLLFMVLVSLSSSMFFKFPPEEFPSLVWYKVFFCDNTWIKATAVTFKVSILSTLIAIILGVPASVGLVKGTFAGKRVAQYLFVTPLIIPVVVIALSQFLFFLKIGLFDSIFALALSYAVLALPLVIISVSAVLSTVDPNLEKAAVNLGCTKLKAFVKVTFPLIRGGILIGAVLAFTMSFNEIVIAIFLTNVQAVTLSKKMWDGIRFEINPTLAVVSTVVLLISLVLCIAINKFYKNLFRHGIAIGKSPSNL
jgi:ABC-type spermidine/putrescine transport system permease subunit II